MTNVFAEYSRYVASGPFHRVGADLQDDKPSTHKARFVAYYLPQFHKSIHNDSFWGEGFTEWTNVTKTLPRFAGHYQPRLPDTFGFYDLSHRDIIRRQFADAARAGVFAFCIHHYWFSGQSALRKPLDLILSDSSIRGVKFFLNWANENWTRKWDGADKEILLKQEYANDDALALALDMEAAIRDPRYLRINGRPVIMIYRPGAIINTRNFIQRFSDKLRSLCKSDLFLIAPRLTGKSIGNEELFDGIAGFAPHALNEELPNLRGRCHVFDRRFEGYVASYRDLANAAIQKLSSEGQPDFPSVCPGWDNDARRNNIGYTLAGGTPKVYGEWLHYAASEAIKKPDPEKRLVFINAWNEWAEGAYLEPDRHNGYAYLCETRSVLDRINNELPNLKAPAANRQEFPTSYFHHLSELERRIVRKLSRKSSRP